MNNEGSINEVHCWKQTKKQKKPHEEKEAGRQKRNLILKNGRRMKQNRTA